MRVEVDTPKCVASGQCVLIAPDVFDQRDEDGRVGPVEPLVVIRTVAEESQVWYTLSNAIDVALHPDSPEGRALMTYLRTSGIPFIAAWGTVPGQTSGAHIHVGQRAKACSTSRAAAPAPA